MSKKQIYLTGFMGTGKSTILNCLHEVCGFDKIEMDEQIVQKILPKIYGDRKQIGELLDTLEKKCSEGIEDSSEEMTLSLKKIEQMKKRLDKYQYASFM